ncbi:hypothetical protein JHN54_11495, partial [Streptomyces sp. MBT70]|nr:hypothetical protein [Streptomyces sp. MBT70]
QVGGGEDAGGREGAGQVGGGQETGGPDGGGRDGGGRDGGSPDGGGPDGGGRECSGGDSCAEDGHPCGESRDAACSDDGHACRTAPDADGCRPAGVQYGVDAGAGGTFEDSVPALAAGAALIAAACAGAGYRLYGRSRLAAGRSAEM